MVFNIETSFDGKQKYYLIGGFPRSKQAIEELW